MGRSLVGGQSEGVGARGADATNATTGDKNKEIAAGGAVETSGSSSSPVIAAGIGGDPSKHLLRVWNAKKADPTVQVFQTSLNRKLAAIKPHSSVSSSLERNVDVSFNKLYGELIQPSHVAQMRLGLGNGPRDKFRRTLEQDLESNKNIPFAYHGVKTMKTGSLFPSYSALLKEKNQKRLETEILLKDDGLNDNESSSQGSLSRMGGFSRSKMKPLGKFNLDAALKNGGVTASSNPNASSESNAFFLTEVDDEIRRMNSEEYLKSHQIEGAFIKDEIDLEFETLQDRIARMKTICNKLLIIEREKERTILDLEKQVKSETGDLLELLFKILIILRCRSFCVRSPIHI